MNIPPIFNKNEYFKYNKSTQSTKKITLIVAGLAGIYFLDQLYVRPQYPSQGVDYKRGDIKIDENGKQLIFLGYTGHRMSVKIETDKDLYYSTKWDAQFYARVNGGLNGGVFPLWVNQMPTEKDHKRIARSRLGSPSYNPLSPEGMANVGLHVDPPEQLTAETNVGVSGPWQRLFKDLKQRFF